MDNLFQKTHVALTKRQNHVKAILVKILHSIAVIKLHEMHLDRRLHLLRLLLLCFRADSTMEESRPQAEDDVISRWLFVRFKDLLADGENRRTKSILHSAVNQIPEEMG